MSASQLRRYPVGSTVPNSVLSQWLRQDSLKAYNAAVSQARQLGQSSNQHFVNVLGSMNFQLGTGWTREFPTLWSLMLQHKWAAAARDAQGTAWARETPVRVRDLTTALGQL